MEFIIYLYCHIYDTLSFFYNEIEFKISPRSDFAIYDAHVSLSSKNVQNINAKTPKIYDQQSISYKHCFKPNVSILLLAHNYEM